MHTKTLRDLIANGARSSRGERQNAGAANGFNRCRQLHVVRAKIMSPFTDAMRFVDHKKERLGLLDVGQDFRLCQLLRSDEDELQWPDSK